MNCIKNKKCVCGKGTWVNVGQYKICEKGRAVCFPEGTTDDEARKLISAYLDRVVKRVSQEDIKSLDPEKKEIIHDFQSIKAGLQYPLTHNCPIMDRCMQESLYQLFSLSEKIKKTFGV